MPDAIRSIRTSSRSRRIAGAALAGGLLLTAAPSTAMAATAFVTHTPQPNGNVTSTAVFRAAPGEINNVRVHEVNRERFDFRDSGRTIIPGPGCRRQGSAVRCTPRSSATTNVAPASVNTNNLNDDIDIVRGRASVNGGSGNDELTTGAGVPGTLSGSSGNDLITVANNSQAGQTLNGGSGNDVLNGGPEGDSIAGGTGDDRIGAEGGNDTADGDPGDDNILGGDGRDQLRGDFGNDRILGNNGRDRIRGQQGADRIAGGNNNDRLGGGPGRDKLWGNGSNDLLVGNSNRDRYRAGPGNDVVRSVDGIRERVNCGTGFDRATIDRRPMDITAFCNRIRRVTFRR
ncbi:MAG: calcium-binding protein [Thermoleophilaceae bacterium]